MIMKDRPSLRRNSLRDHGIAWLVGAAMAGLLLAGCAAPPDDAGNASADATGAQPDNGAGESPAGDAAGDVREITVDIAGGEITPPVGPVEVAEGGTVRLMVTSDVEDVVHVHGFDIEGPVGPDEPFEVEFTADRTGQFEVETHDAGQVLLFLLVR
jgi:FtsP/CotA-like multicopper oxidase with cupredoxin domain